MPRDGGPTRRAILDAALTLLREGGLSGFSVERVAVRAHVAKGLVLYHYNSRSRLIGLCAESVEHDRAQRLAAVMAQHPGIGGVDGLWEEMLRQLEDGTTRAWLALVAAGALTAVVDHNLIAQARRTLLEGCAAALAAGTDRDALRETYEALALALLRMED